MVLFNEICNSCLCSISKRGPLFSSASFPKAVTLPVVPNQDDGCRTYRAPPPPPPTPSSLLSPKTPSTLPSLFLLIMIDGPFVPLYEAVASDEDAKTSCRSTCCATDSFAEHRQYLRHHLLKVNARLVRFLLCTHCGSLLLLHVCLRWPRTKQLVLRVCLRTSSLTQGWEPGHIL